MIEEKGQSSTVFLRLKASSSAVIFDATIPQVNNAASAIVDAPAIWSRFKRDYRHTILVS